MLNKLVSEIPNNSKTEKMRKAVKETANWKSNENHFID